VGQISFTNNGTLRMTASNTFDNLTDCSRSPNQPVGSSAIGFAYAYNTANQRTAVTNADSTRWVYSYDSLGQVISARNIGQMIGRRRPAVRIHLRRYRQSQNDIRRRDNDGNYSGARITTPIP